MDENLPHTPSHDEQLHVPYPRWVIAGVFLLLAAVAVLSVWQMKNRLVISLPQLGEGETVTQIASSLLQAQDEQLRAQDSDQDGLNDYLELRVHGTSPFIADTDSDGVSDADEVAAKTDPTCPAGRSCFGTQGATPTEAPSNNPFLSAEFRAVLDDPAQLRQLLIEGGADPYIINGLDDQTVQILGQEAFRAATTATPDKIEVLKQVTPEQIRGLLKSSGMTDEQLSQFTDERLLEIYNQALSQVVQESSTGQ